VTREAGQVTARREIRVYRFDDDDDLRLVLAHELGHAMGLGHSELAGSIMSPEHRDGSTTEVGRDDVLRLRRLCGG
jgi:predicted Zn-dependent protease